MSRGVLSFEAWWGGRPLRLTRTDFSLLGLLLRHAARVLTRGALFEAIWGLGMSTTANNLQVYVSYLRRKMEAEGEPRLGPRTPPLFGQACDQAVGLLPLPCPRGHRILIAARGDPPVEREPEPTLGWPRRAAPGPQDAGVGLLLVLVAPWAGRDDRRFALRRGRCDRVELHRLGDPDGRYWFVRGYHPRALLAFGAGTVAGGPAPPSTTVYIGPVAGLLGGADVGYLLPSAPSPGVYLPACRIRPEPEPDRVRGGRAASRRTTECPATVGDLEGGSLGQCPICGCRM